MSNTTIFVLAQRTRMHARLGWVGLTKKAKREIAQVAERQPGYTSSEPCDDDTLNPMFHYDSETNARAASVALTSVFASIRVLVQ